jgi:hypothetical protein
MERRNKFSDFNEASDRAYRSPVETLPEINYVVVRLPP